MLHIHAFSSLHSYHLPPSRACPFSGIANKQAVGIVAADKGIKLITKTKAQNKPAKSTRTTVLSGKTGYASC